MMKALHCLHLRPSPPVLQSRLRPQPLGREAPCTRLNFRHIAETSQKNTGSRSTGRSRARAADEGADTTRASVVPCIVALSCAGLCAFGAQAPWRSDSWSAVRRGVVCGAGQGGVEQWARSPGAGECWLKLWCEVTSQGGSGCSQEGARRADQIGTYLEGNIPFRQVPPKTESFVPTSQGRWTL